MVIVLFVPSVMVMFVGCRVGVGVCVGVVVGCGVVVLDGLGVAVVVEPRIACTPSTHPVQARQHTLNHVFPPFLSLMFAN